MEIKSYIKRIHLSPLTLVLFGAYIIGYVSGSGEIFRACIMTAAWLICVVLMNKFDQTRPS